MDAEYIRWLSTIEQQFTDLNRVFVPHLQSFYQKCVEEGFSKPQAIYLTGELIKGVIKEPKE